MNSGLKSSPSTACLPCQRPDHTPLPGITQLNSSAIAARNGRLAPSASAGKATCIVCLFVCAFIVRFLSGE